MDSVTTGREASRVSGAPEPARQDGTTTAPVVFEFRFAPAYRWLAAPFGIGPDTARVTVSDRDLDVRFGPWRMSTPLRNVAGTTRSGPYRRWRTAGPARYSVADHGITLATNGDHGLCIGFHDPVPGLEPTGSLRHPNLTVTVADVPGLDALLIERLGAGSVTPLRRRGRPGGPPEPPTPSRTRD